MSKTYWVGGDADDDRIELLLNQLYGRDITKVIAAGREKFASVPVGGGVGVAVSGDASSGVPPAAAAEPEPTKEEKVEEKEESDEDMGFSLFD